MQQADQRFGRPAVKVDSHCERRLGATTSNHPANALQKSSDDLPRFAESIRATRLRRSGFLVAVRHALNEDQPSTAILGALPDTEHVVALVQAVLRIRNDHWSAFAAADDCY
jgi:hypothetical protein